MLWVGSPPSNEPTTLPVLVVRNVRRAAPQSTHQASWRDYNDANDKESPHSYVCSAKGGAEHPGFMGFMINSHRTQRGAMYTRGLIVTGSDSLGLKLPHNLRHLTARRAAYGWSLSPFGPSTLPGPRHDPLNSFHAARKRSLQLCARPGRSGAVNCAESRRWLRAKVIVSLLRSLYVRTFQSGFPHANRARRRRVHPLHADR
jgi:hypothetical protein